MTIKLNTPVHLAIVDPVLYLIGADGYSLATFACDADTARLIVNRINRPDPPTVTTYTGSVIPIVDPFTYTPPNPGPSGVGSGVGSRVETAAEKHDDPSDGKRRKRTHVRKPAPWPLQGSYRRLVLDELANVYPTYMTNEELCVMTGCPDTSVMSATSHYSLNTVLIEAGPKQEGTAGRCSINTYRCTPAGLAARASRLAREDGKAT